MKIKTGVFRRYLIFAMALSVTAIGCNIAGPLGTAFATTEQRIRALDDAGLEPGLAVLYFHRFKARHLNKMPSGKQAVFDGKPGKPIPYLNHAFGKKRVFDSGTRKEIGMQMSGFLKLSTPGIYGFKAYANDGIRVWVDDQPVADDPVWHAPPGDRYSEPMNIDISKPGWHPMLLRYFQRRGTATLKMYWKRPGDKDFSIIPAEAYAHDPTAVKKK
jgi:PA14 domain-containing protein